MTSIETKECVKLVIDLFPTSDLQDEELKLAAKGFSKFDYAISKQAIEAHRLSNDFRRPKFGQLFAAIRTLHRELKPQDAPKELTTCEIYRRQNPQWANCSDPEIILRFWRSLWVRYIGGVNSRMSAGTVGEGERLYTSRQAQGFGVKCRNGCYSQLVDVSVTIDAARAWSEAIFLDPDLFSQSLEDLKLNGIDTCDISARKIRADFVPAFQSPPEPKSIQPYQALKLLDAIEAPALKLVGVQS